MGQFIVNGRTYNNKFTAYGANLVFSHVLKGSSDYNLVMGAIDDNYTLDLPDSSSVNKSDWTLQSVDIEILRQSVYKYACEYYKPDLRVSDSTGVYQINSVPILFQHYSTTSTFDVYRLFIGEVDRGNVDIYSEANIRLVAYSDPIDFFEAYSSANGDNRYNNGIECYYKFRII